MDDKTLRRSLIRLAHENPQHRAALLPLLKDASAQDNDELREAHIDLEFSVARSFRALSRVLKLIRDTDSREVNAAAARAQRTGTDFEYAIKELVAQVKGQTPNDRLAVFSEPDPRIMMTQYKKLQAEFETLQRWSLTLQTSLRAVGKELPVAKPLMDLQLSQNALGASLEALEPLVHDYLGRRTQS